MYRLKWSNQPNHPLRSDSLLLIVASEPFFINSEGFTPLFILCVDITLLISGINSDILALHAIKEISVLTQRHFFFHFGCNDVVCKHLEMKMKMKIGLLILKC